MKNFWAIILGVIALVVIPSTGGIAMAYVFKSREDFLRSIKLAVARYLARNRSDLGATAITNAGNIITAQAALECGYGKTKAFKEGWNFGNVSAGASWQGETIAGGDLEYDASGNVKKITQQWRKYPTLDAAVADFFTLLSWSRYRAARDALFIGDAKGYAAKLREGGYYTAPLAEYQNGMASALSAAKAIA